MRQTVLVFMGIGASGKSTFAKGLVKSYSGKFQRISSGDIVRTLHKNLTDEEIRADKDFIAKYGLSRYDADVKKCILDRIDNCKKIPVLDGFPRTVDQLIGLTNKEYNIAVVVINVHVVIACQRMEKRNRDEYTTGAVDPISGLVNTGGLMHALSGDTLDYYYHDMLSWHQSLTPVSLPATAWLFCSGLIGLFGIRRNKLKVSAISA